MRYYIADTHFWHEAMLRKFDKRGFDSIEEMHDYMVSQWNKKVRKNDDVVVLGDFSLGTPNQTLEITERLNGHLHLITGNHDQVENKKYDYSRFRWIKDYAELYDNRRRVVLSHYPIMCYNGQYALDKESNARTYMLYGHVHDTDDMRFIEDYIKKMRHATHKDYEGNDATVPLQMINCFCMYSDYQPLTLDEWIDLARSKDWII